MNKKITLQIDQLLAKKMSGNATPAEDAWVTAWLEEDAAHRRHFEEMQHLWRHAKQEAAPSVDVDREWQHFANSLGNGDRKPKVVRLWSTPIGKLAIAASLAGIVWCVSYFWQQPQSSGTMAAETSGETWTTYTATDTNQIIWLPDSSQVTLQPNSVLRVANPFTHRNVTLTGEAFFTVKHDPSSPFTVQSANALITVLGTSFTVRSNDTVSVISVHTGKVMVESNQRAEVLLPLEKLTVTPATVTKEIGTETESGDWLASRGAQYWREISDPASFLSVQWDSKKTFARNPVVEGVVTNTATHVHYESIQLEIIQMKARAKYATYTITIPGPIAPDQKINFLKKLPLLSRIKEVRVNVLSAKPVHDQHQD